MDKNREISLLNVAFDLREKVAELNNLQVATANLQKAKINKWWSMADQGNKELQDIRKCALSMIDAESISCSSLSRTMELLAQQITKRFLQDARKTQAIIDMLIMDTNHLTFKQ